MFNLLVNRRQEHFPLHAGNVKMEQPSVLDNLPRDLIFGYSKFRKRDILAGANLVNQREIRRSQHAQVLAILLVNPFNILSDHNLDAGAKFGVRRLLAARSFATPLPADRRHEATALYCAALDGHFIATLETGVGKFSQCFVEEKTDVRRGDFIGRNVIAQFRIVLRILRVPREVFARQLSLEQLRIFGEKQNSPGQAHCRWPLLDFLV